MLAIVDFDIIEGKRRRFPTQQSAALDDLDGVTFTLQLDCGAETGESRTDNNYMACSHDLAMTASFDRPLKDARRFSGSRGFLEISRRIS